MSDAPAETFPAVRYEAASKRYGSVLALDGLTLDIARGSIFALVGPNGAGKTTAIGLLTGLLEPTSGRAFVFGIESPLERASYLGMTELYDGDASIVIAEIARYEAVTLDDIRRVAAQYLVSTNRLMLDVLPAPEEAAAH